MTINDYRVNFPSFPLILKAPNRFDPKSPTPTEEDPPQTVRRKANPIPHGSPDPVMNVKTADG
jgi:hypothetical protein